MYIFIHVKRDMYRKDKICTTWKICKKKKNKNNFEKQKIESSVQTKLQSFQCKLSYIIDHTQRESWTEEILFLDLMYDIKKMSLLPQGEIVNIIARYIVN